MDSKKIQRGSNKKRKFEFEIIIDKEPKSIFKCHREKMEKSGTLVLGMNEYKMVRKEKELMTELFGDARDSSSDIEGFMSDSIIPDEKASYFPEIGSDPKSDSEEDFLDDELSEEMVLKERKPVWVDENDEAIRVKDVMARMTKARGSRGARETSDEKYESTLREKFSQTIGTPSWAKMGGRFEDVNTDLGDKIQMKASTYLTARSANLTKGTLEFKFVKDLNSDSYAEGALITSIEFNSSLQMALVAGSTKNLGILTLFQFDGKKNHKIQSIKFPKFPVKCATFIENGKKFIVGSHLFGHFFLYDLEEGRKVCIPWRGNEERSNAKRFRVSPDGKFLVIVGNRGRLHFYNASSLSLLESTSVPCSVNAIAFARNSSTLYVCGDNGRVYILDAESRLCLHSFYDDGAIAGTAIAASDKLLACGSSSGVVNIYKLSSVNQSTNPKPMKSVGVLTTSVTSLAFNCTAEILAMASDEKDNALRLLHTPSLTVFANFPGGYRRLRRIKTVAFSPDSKYFSAGNNAGVGHLCRLFHY